MVDHLSLELADLTLEDLHLFGPGEAHSHRSFPTLTTIDPADCRHLPAPEALVNVFDVAELRKTAAEVDPFLVGVKGAHLLSQEFAQLLSFDPLDGSDLLTEHGSGDILGQLRTDRLD